MSSRAFLAELAVPDRLRDCTVLLGRILLALLFVISGFGKIGRFDLVAASIASKGLPLPQIVVVLTILVELGGGLLLVVGLYARWTALALAAFTLVAALVFHNFWAAAPAQFIAQYVNFMKNVSISGGMLVLTAFGPGSISIDARRRGA